MTELEKEEKKKDWYYAQLQNLTKRIDSLPLTENVSAATREARSCHRVSRLSELLTVCVFLP